MKTKSHMFLETQGPRRFWAHGFKIYVECIWIILINCISFGGATSPSLEIQLHIFATMFLVDILFFSFFLRMNCTLLDKNHEIQRSRADQNLQSRFEKLSVRFELFVFFTAAKLSVFLVDFWQRFHRTLFSSYLLSHSNLKFTLVGQRSVPHKQH